MKVRIKDETAKVIKKTEAASITSLGQAGAYIRGIAKRLIRVSAKSSAPGKPPLSRKGRLKKAIFFSVEKEKQGAVIGPTASAVGTIGGTHERGGTEPPKRKRVRKANFKLVLGGHGPIRTEDNKVVVAKLLTQSQVDRATELAEAVVAAGDGSTKKRVYPARPFMGPALEISKERLPKFWANSVKGN